MLCVCDGMALPDNQEYITRAWLMSDRKNVVYYTDLGQKIKREANVVYVSTDSSRTWTALHDFVARVRECFIIEQIHPWDDRLIGKSSRNRHLLYDLFYFSTSASVYRSYILNNKHTHYINNKATLPYRSPLS